MVGIVGPALRAVWHLNAADIGILNTITFGSAAIGRLASGYIGDRYGRRTMLGINLILFTIGAIGCALAPSLGILSLFRAVVGFGLGGLSTAVTMLSEFCSPKFRGTAVGLVNVGAGGFGNFLAPAFGLLIFAIFPGDNKWRWLFASLALPSYPRHLYPRFIPETPRFLRPRQNRRGQSRPLDPRLRFAQSETHHPVRLISPSRPQPSWQRRRVIGIFRPAILACTAASPSPSS